MFDYDNLLLALNAPFLLYQNCKAVKPYHSLTALATQTVSEKLTNARLVNLEGTKLSLNDQDGSGRHVKNFTISSGLSGRDLNHDRHCSAFLFGVVNVAYQA